MEILERFGQFQQPRDVGAELGLQIRPGEVEVIDIFKFRRTDVGAIESSDGARVSDLRARCFDGSD